MAARRACRSLSQSQQLGVSRGMAMLPIKASFAMSGDRSSRGTRSGLSKSAERIRSGDESGNRRVAIRHERREATPIGSRLDCRRFRSFNGGWRHTAGKSMRGDRPLSWRSQRWPRTASLPKPKQRQTANSPGWDRFRRLVWLAGRVVPWHTFNLLGFGLVASQVCHSRYQVAVVRPKRSASIAAVSTL